MYTFIKDNKDIVRRDSQELYHWLRAVVQSSVPAPLSSISQKGDNADDNNAVDEDALSILRRQLLETTYDNVHHDVDNYMHLVRVTDSALNVVVEAADGVVATTQSVGGRQESPEERSSTRLSGSIADLVEVVKGLAPCVVRKPRMRATLDLVLTISEYILKVTAYNDLGPVMRESLSTLTQTAMTRIGGDIAAPDRSLHAVQERLDAVHSLSAQLEASDITPESQHNAKAARRILARLVAARHNLVSLLVGLRRSLARLKDRQTVIGEPVRTAYAHGLRAIDTLLENLGQHTGGAAMAVVPPARLTKMLPLLRRTMTITSAPACPSLMSWWNGDAAEQYGTAATSVQSLAAALCDSRCRSGGTLTFQVNQAAVATHAKNTPAAASTLQTILLATVGKDRQGIITARRRVPQHTPQTTIPHQVSSASSSSSISAELLGNSVGIVVAKHGVESHHHNPLWKVLEAAYTSRAAVVVSLRRLPTPASHAPPALHEVLMLIEDFWKRLKESVPPQRIMAMMELDELQERLWAARPYFLPAAGRRTKEHLAHPLTLAHLASDVHFWALALARIGVLLCLVIAVLISVHVCRKRLRNTSRRIRMFEFNGIFLGISLALLLGLYGVVLMVASIIWDGSVPGRLSQFLLPVEMGSAWLVTNVIGLLITSIIYGSPLYVRMPASLELFLDTMQQNMVTLGSLASLFPYYLLLNS